MTPFVFSPGPPARGQRDIALPAGIESKRELFDILAKAFPLPAYFGHNWDALEECLLDLDWLKAPVTTLIHPDVPLEKNPADGRIYLRILAQAASPRLRFEFPAASRATIDRLLAT